MEQGRIVRRWFAALCLLGAFLGCAQQVVAPGAPADPAARYQPEVRPGMIFSSVQAEMTNLMVDKSPAVFLSRPDDHLPPRSFYNAGSCVVKPTSLELTFGRTEAWRLPLESLVGAEISVQSGTGDESDCSIIKVQGFPWYFASFSKGSARKFADDLCFLQTQAAADSAGNSALVLTAEFEAQAAQFRAAAVKPAVTEAQRRYIVQANALGQMKDYQGALDLYRKALEVDPVAYPACYFNMALLAVGQDRYRTAISLMKKYLLLVPDAKDARAAQDKIYEWEILLQNR